MSQSIVAELVTIYKMQSSGQHQVQSAFADTAAKAQQAAHGGTNLAGTFSALQEHAEQLASGGFGGLLSTVDSVTGAVASGSASFSSMIPIIGAVAGAGLLVFEVFKKIAEGIVEAAEAFYEFSNEAIHAYGKVFDLKAGLEATMGSAAAAGTEFKRLQKLAELPGLNLEVAEQGANRLMMAGASAALAEKTVRELGNAMARSGHHAEETGVAIEMMSRMMSEGKVRGRELMLLFREMPEVGKALKSAFGTSDPKALEAMSMDSGTFLRKLVGALAETKRAIKGPEKELENLRETAELAMASAGESIERHFLPDIIHVEKTIQRMTDGGVFNRLADQVSRVFGGGTSHGGLFEEMVFVAVAGTQTIAKMIQELELGISMWLDDILRVVNLVVRLWDQSPIGKAFHLDEIKLLQGGPFDDAVKDFKKNLDELHRLYGSTTGGDVGGSIADTVAQAADSMSDDGANGPQSQTAKNTAKLVEIGQKQLDIQRMVLGGGDRAAHALSNADLAGLHGGQHSVGHKIQSVIDAYVDAKISEMLVRQGRLAR